MLLGHCCWCGLGFSLYDTCVTEIHDCWLSVTNTLTAVRRRFSSRCVPRITHLRRRRRQSVTAAANETTISTTHVLRPVARNLVKVTLSAKSRGDYTTLDRRVQFRHHVTGARWRWDWSPENGYVCIANVDWLVRLGSTQRLFCNPGSVPQHI